MTNDKGMTNSKGPTLETSASDGPAVLDGASQDAVVGRSNRSGLRARTREVPSGFVIRFSFVLRHSGFVILMIRVIRGPKKMS